MALNLHGVVSPVIAAVNPQRQVTIRQSTGYTTGADGTRSPTYETSTVNAQIQALTAGDIQILDGLNIVGLRRKLYFFGALNSLVRGLQKGGDLVTFPDGSVWLLVYVFENYNHGVTGPSGWCSVAVTLQDSTAEC